MIDILHCERWQLSGQYHSGTVWVSVLLVLTYSLLSRVGYLPSPRQICAPSNHPHIASSEEASPLRLGHMRITDPDPDSCCQKLTNSLPCFLLSVSMQVGSRHFEKFAQGSNLAFFSGHAVASFNDFSPKFAIQNNILEVLIEGCVYPVPQSGDIDKIVT